MKSRTTLLSLALLTAGLTLGACNKPQIASQGARGIQAKYSMGRLSATLPAEATVPAVIAAADQTARARGYTVVTNTATAEQGNLICRPPRSDSFPRVVIWANRSASGTDTTLAMEPFGDQDLCRSMLDGILQRLGL
ncbi:MAG: hypothetical protein U0637_04845 [Phycisphaerales bacterium]